MVEGADYDSKAWVNKKIPESHEKAKKMTATVGCKVSENSPKDWVYKRFPTSFEEVGKVHNKVERTEVSSPKACKAGRYDDFRNVHNGAVHSVQSTMVQFTTVQFTTGLSRTTIIARRRPSVHLSMQFTAGLSRVMKLARGRQLMMMRSWRKRIILRMVRQPQM